MYDFFFSKKYIMNIGWLCCEKVNLFFNIEFWSCGGHSVLGKATIGRSSTRYLLTRDSFPPSPTRDSFPGPGRPASFMRTVDRSSCAGLRVSWRFARARPLARSLDPCSSSSSCRRCRFVSCVRGLCFVFLFPFCLWRLASLKTPIIFSVAVYLLLLLRVSLG